MEWPLWAQTGDLSKLDPELQTLMHDSRDGNETFRVIIEMKDQYDNPNLERGTSMMTRAERRDYVVNELKRFSESSQAEVTRYLDAQATRGGVRVLHNFWIFNGVCCEATAACIDDLSMRNDVRYISLDKEMELDEPEQPKNTRGDLLQGEQWHISKIRASGVWNNEVWENEYHGYTGRGVVIAIIDSGVNYLHPDIAENMWDGGDEFPNHGWNFGDNNNDPMDYGGHGTHVAGIVASNGSTYKAGVAPGAKIMALKYGLGRASWCSAIEFAVGHGADIINMSIGYPGIGGGMIELRDAFVNAMNAGVVATVAAGNYGDRLWYYQLPKNITDVGACPPPWHNDDQMEGGTSAVICVGNTDKKDRKCWDSSEGPVTWQFAEGYQDYCYEPGNPDCPGLIRPDVAAPGDSIWSLNFKYTNSEGLINEEEPAYVQKRGTSMAAPCVAGVIALMLEANPNLSPSNIDEILETTAIPCEGQDKKNNRCGAGRVDARSAVEAALNYPTVEACHLSVTSDPFGCFDVTVTSEPYGFIDVKNGVALPKGTSCTINAPNINPFSETQPFLYWKKNGTICYDGVTFYNDYVTLDITLNEDVEVVAVYTNVCKHISVSTESACSSVSGAGNYLVGDFCTLVASPNALPNGEQIFLGWKKDGDVVSTENPFTFEVLEDGQYEAIFVDDCRQIHLFCYDGHIGGTIDDDYKTNYHLGETCQLEISIPDCYILLHYRHCHCSADQAAEQGLLANPDDPRWEILRDDMGFVITDPHYSFVVFEDDTFIVWFERKNSYNVTANVFPLGGGVVEGSGTYCEGDLCTLTAIPSQGSVFYGWYDNYGWHDNNNGCACLSPEYTFVVKNNVNVTAMFVPYSAVAVAFSPTLQDLQWHASILHAYSDAINNCSLASNRDSNEEGFSALISISLF